MNILRLLRIAIKSILKNRTRSFLTALGIIIGVGSVIIMTAVGRGSQARIQEDIQSMGTNMIMVMNGRMRFGGVSQGSGSRKALTMDDVEAIRQAEHVEAVSPVIRASGQVIGGSGNWSTSIEGVVPEYMTIRNYSLASGEMFTQRDVDKKKKVCVVGQTVVDELFSGSDPIGQKIRVRNTPFIILGVLKEKGESGMGNDQDDIILAPST
jgi:putative ABC transport system permease protein